MKLDMQVLQDFKVFSKQALWGSKKSLVALDFLERSIKEGLMGWPNLMIEIMACKTLDLVGILRWVNRCSFKKSAGIVESKCQVQK